MRKLLLLFFVGISLISHAEKLKFSYHFANLKIKQINEFCTLNLPNTKNQAFPGDPLQPFFATNILLPQGAKIISVDIKSGAKTQFKVSSKLLPAQYPLPISKASTYNFVINKKSYSNSIALSQKNSLTYTQGVANGYNIAMVKFSPIEYYPELNKVNLSKDVVITINYIIKSSKKSELMLSNRQEITNRIKQLCENTSEISKYEHPKKKGQTIDALIITSEAFVNSLKVLQNQYLSRGYETQIISTESISENYQGVDLQEKIRNAIISYYQNNDLKYVLLGGDIEIVPARGLYCQVQSSEVYSDENIPADIYYSSLDGTWNTDNDNLWGEPEESDLLPDVAVARLPFSTQTDLDNMLHKDFMYSNNPVVGDLNKPLLAGEKLYDNPLTWGAQYLDLIHGTHNDSGYVTTGIPDNSPFDTLYDRNNPWTAQQLRSEINSGHSFIHHVGHSNATYAMRMSNSDIVNENFEPLDGITHLNPLVYTHGCICGSFDYDDCIAEEMLKIQKFAVAFVGNSRYGWFNEGQTEGPSAHLHREFVNALYTDKINILAEDHLLSKLRSAVWVEAPNQHEYGALRWVFYDCNALGDPLLAIWTDTPVTPNVTLAQPLHVGDDSCHVIVKNGDDFIKNARIALMKNNVLFGKGISDSLGNCSIELTKPFVSLGQVNLIVSGYNVIKDTTVIELQHPAQAYVYAKSLILGNNDDNPHFGVTYHTNVIFENIGLTNSESVQLSVKTTCPFVEITDVNQNIPIIASEDTFNCDNCFTLKVSDTIPDKTNIEIEFYLVSNSDTLWHNVIDLTAMAPNIVWTNLSIDDSEGGNSNGVIDHGELVLFKATAKNIGSLSPQLFNTQFNCNSNLVNILTSEQNSTQMQAGDSKQFIFPIQVSSEATQQTEINFVLKGIFDNYNPIIKNTSYKINNAIETFESQTFNTFPWQNNSPIPWVIDATNHHNGAYSACSGDINDNTETQLSLQIHISKTGDLSFWYKVSSEESYDKLIFYIDGVEQYSASGILDWTEKTYNLAIGEHTLVWKYKKDFTASYGSDCAWIDDITLPISSEIVNNTPPEITSQPLQLLSHGQYFEHTLTAQDAEDDSLTASVAVGPDWINISQVENTNKWKLSGTVPDTVQNNPQLVVVVSDGKDYTGQASIININGTGFENKLNTNEVSIYPQPANNELHIKISNFITNSTVKIYNMDGKIKYINTIYGANKESNSIKISVKDFSPGVYILSITNNHKSILKKIIIN